MIGLYMDSAKHPVVLSVDDKSPIQPLDRTQPGLPTKPGSGDTGQEETLTIEGGAKRRRHRRLGPIPEQS